MNKLNILSIDPGPTTSGYVVWDGKQVLAHGIPENRTLLMEILPKWYATSELIVEKIVCLGMAVGASVFETVFWTGRFCERWYVDSSNTPWGRFPRLNVKLHLCQSSRAKDSNIRQALIDRFEPDLKPKCRPKGIMKGLKADSLQAFALAVTWYDLNLDRRG